MALLERAGAFLAILAFGSASLAAEDPVGWVAQADPKVTGRRADQRPDQSPDLIVTSEVVQGMEVKTGSGAGARIALNPYLNRRGMVELGPETIVKFTKHLLDRVRGLEEMSLLVKLGQLRLALFPPSPDDPLEADQYMIITPDCREIRLDGTDVAVRVDPDGTTTVWVFEGEVTIQTPGVGGPVRVHAGQQISMAPGGEPESPVPFNPTDPPGPRPSPHPGEWIFEDPAGLDLRGLRLDLPQ